MSAKSRKRRWTHEIQIALIRRRAAMTRAVVPNSSTRADWLLAGIIDRALHHWGHVPLLTVELETTTTQTPRLTQPYQITTMTSPPSPVNRQHLPALTVQFASAFPMSHQTSHHGREIPDLRAQGILYRPLVWTADGQPLNPTVRSGHRVLPQRTSTVGKSHPAQIGT